MKNGQRFEFKSQGLINRRVEGSSPSVPALKYRVKETAEYLPLSRTGFVFLPVNQKEDTKVVRKSNPV